jgi:hypothetical protein
MALLPHRRSLRGQAFISAGESRLIILRAPKAVVLEALEAENRKMTEREILEIHRVQLFCLEVWIR